MPKLASRWTVETLEDRTVPAGVIREMWTDVGGDKVGQIPLLLPPSSTSVLTRLEAPSNTGDFYGDRTRGYIAAPTTGLYRFWVSGDDGTDFKLSPTNQPELATRIAYVDGWTNERQWNKFSSQRSVSIFLIAGQQYFFEVLHKENNGPDNWAVGWAKPGQAQNRPSQVIPGAVLVNYATPPTTGGAYRELWTDAPGDSTLDTPYALQPNATSILTSLQGPSDAGDFYGDRTRGYIVAPTTGSYTFWISGDDGSDFYLSTNEQPVNRTRIAYVEGWTEPLAWTTSFNQESAPVNLVAGQKYYFEMLHKENNGPDHVAVGWTKPGDALGAPSEIVPGSVLSPYGTPPPTGFAMREQWNNVPGDSTLQTPYALLPNATSILTSLQGPSNAGDFYGDRTRGYVIAPFTGNYTFWISGDDGSDFYLSTDESVANQSRIAYVDGWTEPLAWTTSFNQESAPVNLVAGQKYYFEMLHKENNGPDHVAVGWTKPGDAPGAPSEIVPGAWLAPYTGAQQTAPPLGEGHRSLALSLLPPVDDTWGTVRKKR